MLGILCTLEDRLALPWFGPEPIQTWFEAEPNLRFGFDSVRFDKIVKQNRSVWAKSCFKPNILPYMVIKPQFKPNQAEPNRETRFGLAKICEPNRRFGFGFQQKG